MTVMSDDIKSSISSLASNANTKSTLTLTSGPGSTTAYIDAYSINTKPNINRDWSKNGLGFNNGNTVYQGNIYTFGCRSVY